MRAFTTASCPLKDGRRACANAPTRSWASRARTASCSPGSPTNCTCKRTPELRFIYDGTTDRAMRVGELLEDEQER